MYFYRHLIMYTPHVQFICTPALPTPTANPTPTSALRTTFVTAPPKGKINNQRLTPRSYATYPVGVALPLECDMLYGASTFFALQIRHARFRTLPSACTTSGANSMPNICWMA